MRLVLCLSWALQPDCASPPGSMAHNLCSCAGASVNSKRPVCSHLMGTCRAKVQTVLTGEPRKTGCAEGAEVYVWGCATLASAARPSLLLATHCALVASLGSWGPFGGITAPSASQHHTCVPFPPS